MGESLENEPKLYSEVKGVPEWENAVVEEISALNKNGMWELLPKPYDADLITCKWVYKLKKKANNTIDRYKARLVARGFSQ
ncbi:UNVERIFIED_CONTAM: Copia protein [Sesamum angustifolium]|uniref:Copia protein n=1 Tax=Sesamum angustifolium TaxID=2727405 RepID=A0AAW2J5H2_9LAMI